MKSANRALKIQLRYEPAPVIPLKQDGSLLEWLQDNNRIISRPEKVEELIIPDNNEEFDLGEEIDLEDDDDESISDTDED